MGTVYLVRDVALDCLRAVKVLRPESWTAEAAQQFVNEARILARLRHPHIVPVHQQREKDGLNYYVMDYLEGETLQSQLERTGPLPLNRARKLGRDLLDALEWAHTNGVIHRDVKPANLFVGEKRAVLTDFGIARQLTAQEKTDPAILKGTAAYMAPEQFAGVAADARTDIYAAGMVVYEALTGVRWEKEDPRKNGSWGAVPWLVARVLRKSLALEAEKRWSDAVAFRRALRRTRIWPFQFRTLLLTLGGLLVGATASAVLSHQRVNSRWPFHPSASVQLYITPFETTDGTKSAVATALARDLVTALTGYPDFVVYGPGSPPWLPRKADLVLRAAVREVGESVQVNVQIRAGSGGEAGVFTVPGDLRRPGSLLDSVEVAVVRAIWNRENPLDPSLPVQALPHSGAGLAAWLAAERLLAQARWGEADAAYRVAEATDSTCFLCYWRHSEVRQWLAQDADPALAARYLSHLDSFPPRYQNLMSAASLALEARLDALRAATRRWPDFFLAWFQLGDELYHRGPLVGFARSDAIEAFQMTTRRRPAFGPAHEHLAWALTAEGDSAGAATAEAALDSLGTPRDSFTLALRGLLQVGYAYRFLDSVTAREIMIGLVTHPEIQHFPGLAAGPRYLPTFDAPRGAVEMGVFFAASPDRALERSGLIAEALGLVALGRLTAARDELDRLRDRFNEPEVRLMRPELDGALWVLGFEPDRHADEWFPIAQTLAREADARSATIPARQRVAWLLTLGARRSGGADTARYQRILAAEPMPRPLSRLLAADALARRGNFAAAVRASDALRELEASALSGATPTDPFFRALLHALRAEWSAATGRVGDASRELLWYESNDASGLPTRDPQVGDIDWALGTFARWRRAPLLERERRHDAACHAYRDVARLWAHGDAPYRARADSAASRLTALGCRQRS